MGPRAQTRSLDYEEDHCHELEDAAGKHPQVENTVQIAHVFGNIERHAHAKSAQVDPELYWNTVDDFLDKNF